MPTVDVAAYCARIGVTVPQRADLTVLRALHLHHPLAIPFENLSTLLREPIPLDTASLQRKLVVARRGGYCFEQNRLFADVLAAVGYDVACLAARVVWNRGPQPPNPRTHMILKVDVGAEAFIADVGFGGLTLTAPLLLVPDIEQRTPHEVFRFTRRGGEYELQAQIDAQWRVLYTFDLQEQLPVDFEVLNHLVATHPESHFRTTLIAARRTLDGRYALLNRELSEYRGAEKRQRELRSAEEIARALRDLFGVELPRDPGLLPVLEAIAAA